MSIVVSSLQYLGYILIFPGFLFCSVAGLLLCGIDRKLVAKMQKRVGPPVLQPFYDFFKLCGKETIIPAAASSKTMFLLAPLVGLAALVVLQLFIPIFSFSAFSGMADMIVVLYLLLIIVFAYFYMTIQYNPLEMANNLRQNNGTIPGIRPGRPTAEFISKVLSKVTLIGALFLAVVAILPIIYGNLTGMVGLQMGGTSVIIMVGVALETVKQIESQMMMRHYKGFLD